MASTANDFFSIHSGTPREAPDCYQRGGDRTSTQQLNTTNDKITRVNDQWLRPAAAGTYQLQFSGGGGERTINFSVDRPVELLRERSLCCDPNSKIPVTARALIQANRPPDVA